MVPAGARADHTPHLLAAVVMLNLACAATVVAVPVLFWAGQLTLATLLVAAVLVAVTGAIRSAYTTPLMVTTVPGSLLPAANGTLNAARSTADIAGLGLGSLLLATVAAPLALLVDGLSFVAAAVLLLRLRGAAPTAPAPLNRTARERGAWAALLGAMVRRPDVWCLAGIAATGGLLHAVLVWFCVHSLALAPPTVAALLATGAAGGIGGGLAAGRITAWCGPRLTVVVGVGATIAGVVPLPFAHPGPTAIAAVTNLELATAFGGVLAVTAVMAALQQVASPAGTTGRVTALAVAMLQLAGLVGLATGGIVATATSVPTAITTGAVGIVVTTVAPAMWLLLPGRQDRSVPLLTVAAVLSLAVLILASCTPPAPSRTAHPRLSTVDASVGGRSRVTVGA
jgi:hypothetical protein